MQNSFPMPQYSFARKERSAAQLALLMKNVQRHVDHMIQKVFYTLSNKHRIERNLLHSLTISPTFYIVETFGPCNSNRDCCTRMDAPCFVECKEDKQCRYASFVLDKQDQS